MSYNSYENVKIKTSLLDSDGITFNPQIGAAYILELDGLTQYQITQGYSAVVFGYWGRSEDPETGLTNLCIYPPIGNYHENNPNAVGYYRGRVTYNNEEYDSWYWDNPTNTIVYTDIITEHEFFDFGGYCPNMEDILMMTTNNRYYTAVETALFAENYNNYTSPYVYNAGSITDPRDSSKTISYKKAIMCANAASISTSDISNYVTSTSDIILYIPGDYYGRTFGINNNVLGISADNYFFISIGDKSRPSSFIQHTAYIASVDYTDKMNGKIHNLYKLTMNFISREYYYIITFKWVGNILTPFRVFAGPVINTSGNALPYYKDVTYLLSY